MGLKLVINKLPIDNYQIHICDYQSLAEAKEDAAGEEQVLTFLNYESSFKDTTAFDALIALSHHFLGSGESFGEELENLLTKVLKTGIEIGQEGTAKVPGSREEFTQFFKIFEHRLEKLYPGKISFIPPEDHEQKGEITQAAIWLPESDFDKDPDAFGIFCLDGTVYFTNSLPGLIVRNEKISWEEAVSQLLQFVNVQSAKYQERYQERYMDLKRLEQTINILG